MKILLVVPKYNLTNQICYDYMFPLGLAYIAAALKKQDYHVDYLNLNHIEGTIENALNKVLSKVYDVVCTGHIGTGYAIVEKIVKSVKIHPTKPKIILGGTLITSEPELTLTSLRPDYIVIGEGELTIVELLKTIEENKNPEGIPGIGFLKDNKPVFTKARELIKNIDEIPFPNFEDLGFNQFLENQSNGSNFCEQDYPRTYPILCSRGCPYQCTFCYHSIGIKYRERSLDNIFNEINLAINKYKINSLMIYDDLFSVNKKRLFEFCDRIKKLSDSLAEKIGWSCQLSVKNVDKEMLLKLKESGCNLVSFGFESYSNIVLKSMKKPITPEEIDNAVKLCREVGVGLQANFIFGDSAETKETAKMALDYWKNNCNGQVQLGFIQAYPGSEIFKRCIEKGIIKDKLDYIRNNLAHTNWLNMTDSMTDQQILDLKKEILDSRWKYCEYVVPIKKKKTDNGRYDLTVKCPFCNEIVNYKNTALRNSFHYSLWFLCRNCYMRFYLSSRLYRFEAKHYQKLDFFRKKYLYIRDNILKKRI